MCSVFEYAVRASIVVRGFAGIYDDHSSDRIHHWILRLAADALCQRQTWTKGSYRLEV